MGPKSFFNRYRRKDRVHGFQHSNYSSTFRDRKKRNKNLVNSLLRRLPLNVVENNHYFDLTSRVKNVYGVPDDMTNRGPRIGP